MIIKQWVQSTLKKQEITSSYNCLHFQHTVTLSAALLSDSLLSLQTTNICPTNQTLYSSEETAMETVEQENMQMKL